jgi:hypothetical protein
MGEKKQKPPTVVLEPGLQAWRSPIQRQLDGLLVELASFNERIAELVAQGHRSLAMSVLKAQALSLAGQIDELRGLLSIPRASQLSAPAPVVVRRFRPQWGRRPR